MQKKLYAICLSLILFSTSALYPQLILKNRFLKIAVDDLSCRFSIKSIDGNPFETNDSSFKILDDTCSPPTTFASIKLNNEIYNFGSSAGNILQTGITDNSIISTWNLKGILISQKLSLTFTNSDPAVKIEYVFSNPKDSKMETGLRLCLDTALASGFPVYITPDISRIISETNINGLYSWYSIDALPDPKIFLHFIIPDRRDPLKIAFSSWDKFSKSSWDIAPERRKSFFSAYPLSKKYDDSIGAFWDIAMLPFTSKTCSLLLVLESPKVDENSINISYIPSMTPETNAICFKVKNNSLKVLKDIFLELKTGNLTKVHFDSPSTRINRLELFDERIVRYNYSTIANTDEDLTLKISALPPYKTSHETKVSIVSPGSKLNITTLSNNEIITFPMRFYIRSPDNIKAINKFINIYDNDDIKIYRIILPQSYNNISAIDYSWDGKMGENETIPGGAYYYYSTSFSNSEGNTFESGKNLLICLPEPVTTEKKIIYSFPDINFDYKSSVLKKFAYRILDYIGMELTKNTNLKFLIEGHTDNTGEEEKNISLSEERAKSVYYYLIAKYNLSESKFKITGLGSSVPVADNSTDKGRQKNRRVEVIIEK